jgi:hypothetical protein
MCCEHDPSARPPGSNDYITEFVTVEHNDLNKKKTRREIKNEKRKLMLQINKELDEV